MQGVPHWASEVRGDKWVPRADPHQAGAETTQDPTADSSRRRRRRMWEDVGGQEEERIDRKSRCRISFFI